MHGCDAKVFFLRCQESVFLPTGFGRWSIFKNPWQGGGTSEPWKNSNSRLQCEHAEHFDDVFKRVKMWWARWQRPRNLPRYRKDEKEGVIDTESAMLPWLGLSSCLAPRITEHEELVPSKFEAVVVSWTCYRPINIEIQHDSVLLRAPDIHWYLLTSHPW